jgi:hypothetical protein
MWWQFKSAVVRKLGYLLAALVFALLLGHRAHADAVCELWNNGAGASGFASADAACSSYNGTAPGFAVGTATNAHITAGPSGTSPGQIATCTFDHTYPDGTVIPAAGASQVNGYGGACPNNCAGLPNQDLLATIAAASSATVSGYCVNSCEFLNGNAALSIGGGNRLAGLATPSGASCGSAATDAPAVAGSCVSQGGTINCVTDSPPGANLNGDAVTASSAPASGSCQAFSSGGVMCTVAMPTGTTPSLQNPQPMPTPPGPDNGTPGSPATPSAVVIVGGKQVSYFNAATVAASSVGVGTSGVTSTGAAGASGSSPASSPCPAGQTCSGTTDATSGGDDCAAPPTCTDTDPNVCAIVRGEWLTRCQSLTPITEAQIATAVTTMGGDVGTVPSSTVDVSTVISTAGSAQFGAVTASGSATCPPPLVVTIMGQSLSLDLFAHVCEFASQISWIILVIAYMVAARVMFTGATANSF